MTCSFKRLLLAGALALVSAGAASASDDDRVAFAATMLKGVAEVSPNVPVAAAAFFREGMTTEGVQARLEGPNWEGIDVRGFRHETGERRGGYIRRPSDKNVEQMLKRYQIEMALHGIPPEQLRIVGVDIEGEAVKLRALSENEGIMVEVGRKGNFAPAPSFTKPEESRQDGPGCDGLSGPCASPFTPTN